MSVSQQKILGCSFDGLKDRLFVAGQGHSREVAYAPATVVLPLHQFGQLLVGSRATETRVSSGLSWPPEAWVNPGSLVCRVPVSYAWRLLVDAGDKTVRWSVGKGVSFPLAKIIAAHIVGHLEGVGHNQDTIIITIPNDLDEFGQEGLLQEIKRQGLPNVKLVWRPVAAALAWLEQTQNAFPQAIPIPADDFILVVHLGPDCMEFVPFRLKERECQGQRYVIPLREPPKVKVVLGGCDWAADLIDSIVDTDDSGAFWWALTGFPEVWETLAHRDWNREHLPRIWSRRDSWELWNPPESLHKSMWQVAARKSARLSELTRSSCLDKRPFSSYGSWLDLIQTRVKQAAEVYGGQLRGMILSGPLASSLSTPWLAGIMSFLQSKGLRTPPSPEAVPDGIWVPGFERDAVSEGATIYGARLLSGEPTYLDTLPQLWMYVQDRGTLDWVALLKNEAVAGGRKFEDVLKQKFSLPGHSKTLQVFLRKGNEQIRKASFRFPYVSEAPMPLDTHIEMSPASGLAQIELVPIKTDFLRGQRVFLDYSLMEDATEADLPKPKLGSPLITKILIDPTDSRILESDFRSVCEEFIKTNVDDRQYYHVVKKLKNVLNKPTRFQSSSNEWISGRIVDQNGNAGTQVGQELIKQISAKLGGDLRELLASLDRLLMEYSERRHCMEAIEHIRQAATWLFAGAPPKVIDHLKSELQAEGKMPPSDVVEAAGRSFVDVEDLKILYGAILERVRHPRDRSAFPIQSARAIYRIMELRECGPNPKAMTRKDAETFVAQALINMEQCVEKKSFKQTFFQAVKLFLYLLRYREIDQTFLLHDNQQDRQLFDRAIDCLEFAQNYVRENPIEFQNALLSRRTRTRRVADLTTARRTAEKAAYLMDEIRKYMFLEGDSNIIPVLNAFANTSDEP